MGVYIGVLYEVLRILGVILHLKGKNANVFHRFTPRFVVAEARETQKRKYPGKMGVNLHPLINMQKRVEKDVENQEA